MLDTMTPRGTRGAYRKEDRVQLPPELQKERVEKAAARYGNCQELAKHLSIPKSSVHYYRIGGLTMPMSILKQMLEIANDDMLRDRIESRGITKDRSWATEYAQDVFREMCREKLRLPTREDLEHDAELRRKAAAIVSYVLAEGSVWLQKEEFGEHAVNITFADHEEDLYEHFRSLCLEVFRYDIGPAQKPGNNARAIRGFIYSRFIAEWLVENGVNPGEKSAQELHLPSWIMNSEDSATWIAALQPWCDGEGSPICGGNGRIRGYSLGQSRHADLDLIAIPKELIDTPDRGVGIRKLDGVEVYGMQVLDYISTTARSEIMSDLSCLFGRLGLRPRIKLNRVHLKDDGFWSCFWCLTFCREDAISMFDWGLVTTVRKRRRMESGR